jgi:hypothetical protein
MFVYEELLDDEGVVSEQQKEQETSLIDLRLIDLGGADLLDSADPPKGFGSAHFMAPEQFPPFDEPGKPKVWEMKQQLLYYAS